MKGNWFTAKLILPHLGRGRNGNLLLCFSFSLPPPSFRTTKTDFAYIAGSLELVFSKQNDFMAF